MSTQLFSGSLPIPSGTHIGNAIAVPNGVQSLGQNLQVDLSMTGSAFPNGSTTITVGISTDNGASYREASGTYTAPFAPGKGGGTPNQSLGFTVADASLVTHVRLSTSAPSAFNLPVTITVTGV
jgi:hypothetical protein